MNGTRTGLGWGSRLLIALVLILCGAAAATWGLAHFRPAARFLGVVEPSGQSLAPANRAVSLVSQPAPTPALPQRIEDQKIADLESRVSRVENATARAEGSAGRADALVIAFAARRAVDRGVALGYLENLLVDRFGAQHRAAVATVITTSRQPVRLDDLITEFDSLGKDLRRGGPQDSWWTNFQRQFGELVEIHSIDQPATNPDATYERARQRLVSGNVDQALAEVMRLPGASRGTDWVEKARRYIAAHRALDEIESAALLPGPDTGP